MENPLKDLCDKCASQDTDAKYSYWLTMNIESVIKINPIENVFRWKETNEKNHQISISRSFSCQTDTTNHFQNNNQCTDTEVFCVHFPINVSRICSGVCVHVLVCLCACAGCKISCWLKYFCCCLFLLSLSHIYCYQVFLSVEHICLVRWLF